MIAKFGQTELKAAKRLITMGLEEDLASSGDQTCQSMIADDEVGQVLIRCRQPGVLAGLPCAAAVFEELDSRVRFHALAEDGHLIEPGKVVAELDGPLSSLLIGERTALNFMTHLSGIASLTRQFADHVAGTRSVILDTRKTLPGYRVLQKYAVRCGGGTNHRMGLYDGILIKDNHLAAWSRRTGANSVADAVRAARRHTESQPDKSVPDMTVEVEVDSLDQLRDALGGHPDIVLLDNMAPSELMQAIEIRNEMSPEVQLEASGGITLETVQAIAETGVERISIGGLTHSAVALDLAFDWDVSDAN